MNFWMWFIVGCMAPSKKCSHVDAISPGETPLETVAGSISRFRQALAELTIAAEQSAAPCLQAMPFDDVLAYISRLATILQDLAAEPNAADARSALDELQIEMTDAVRALHGDRLH